MLRRTFMAQKKKNIKKLFQSVFNKHGKPAVGTAGSEPLLDDREADQTPRDKK